MPFTKLADITSHDKYKSILKAELGKVDAERVKYHYFEKVKLTGGSPEGDPFLLMGTFSPAMVDELKKAGDYKARGTLCEAPDKSIEYTVMHGALKPAVLKKAFAEVKTVVVKETEPGVVVETAGGRDAPPETDRKAEGLKAQLEKLRAAYGNVAGKMEVGTRGKLRELLQLADQAKQAQEWTSLEKHVTAVTMLMTAYARERQLAVKATEGPMEAAAALAVAEVKRVDDTQTSIKDLEAQIKKAETLVTDAQLDLTNAMKSVRIQGPQPAQPQPAKGQAQPKPQPAPLPRSVRDAQQKVVNATESVAGLKRQLATAKVELAKNPGLAQQLVANLQALSKRIEDADRDYKAWADQMGFGVPTPGKVAASPGLQAAKDDLAAKLPGVADSKQKLLALIDKHVAAADKLRKDHDALAKDVLALTGLALSDAAISPYEKDVEALQQRFEKGPDPRDLSADTVLTKQGAAGDAWVKQRAAQVEQVNKLDIPAKLKTHLAAKWGATDAAMKEAKAGLDAALSGAAAVSGGDLGALTKKLATAGTPSWNADWVKGQEATMKSLAGKEAPFDDMPGWARAAYLKARDEVSGSEWKAGLKKVEDQLLGELKKRMTKLITDVAGAFADLREPRRRAVSDELNGAVRNMKLLKDATSVLEQFRYRTSWEYEEKLAAQMKAELSALDLARRPTRAQWAEHLEVPENGYRMVRTPQTFEYAGATYRTHFTVSYDSVSGARPSIFGVAPQTVINVAFTNSVPMVLQAHATIEFPSAEDNPHLYLTGDIHPKNLQGEDRERAKVVLTQVRAQMLEWLRQQIVSLQATLH